MNIKKFNFILSTFLLLALLVTSVFAEGDEKNKNNTLEKTLGAPVRTFMSINNIFTVIKNDGISDIDVNEANSGLVFPAGSGKTAVFTSGFLWGAFVPGDPQVRVGGTAYRTGLQPGRITNSGLPWDQLIAEPNVAGDHVRIYRVRPDVYPGGPEVNLTRDANLENNSASSIRAQYELDWTEWPAQYGAPYDDIDNNGIYDPNVDIPGVPGANQTIWFVANDLNPSRTQNLYGALPLGIEMQATFWAYSQSGALGNMFFRRYKIINKSNTPFDSMYVSMFSDVDLGNSADDFAGCDVDLSLGYCYNANANDPTYNPLPPPAVGFDFFQGPKVNGVPLPMTAFYYFARGNPAVVDPTQGDIQGSNQFYNFFQGKIGLTGESFTDPITGQPTSFAVSGDPQTGSGWLDGLLIPADDRRIGSASGPFTMAAGDTQEVVVAEIVAGAIPGVDRISAIGLLKFYDRQAQVAYDNNFDLPVPPPAPNVTVVGSESGPLNGVYYGLDNKIVLNWGTNPSNYLATENSNSKGYVFEGYNVYQLPNASASVSEGRRIATYDLANGIGKIEDLVFDVNTGSVVKLPVQFGNDSGIKRYLEITGDVFNNGEPLINGIRYYYAVTAYNYNPDPQVVPNNLENPIQILTIIPQSNTSGFEYGETQGSTLTVTHNGTADGVVDVKVIDPQVLTGHEYEVFFTERQEIRDNLGEWIPAATVRRLFGPDTLTGSSIDIAAVYGTNASLVDLNFSLDLVSVDDNWADGIVLTFPPQVQIVSAPSFEAGGGTVTPEIVGNTVILGLVDTSLTEDGIFHGGEEWSFTVSGPLTLPVTIDWEIFDDGYSGGPLNAIGNTTVSSIGNLSRLAKYWNLRDVNTSTVKLENQSIIGGEDIFPKRDDIPTNIGTNASTIVDGFQTNVDVGYAAPTTLSPNNPPTVNGVETSYSGDRWVDDNFIFTDFTYFGYPDGLASTSFPLYGGAGGTADINLLQQDYELRWTGVTGDTTIGGVTITITKSGGSIATLFGASGYSLANHPLNPSPGTDEPFTVRIPFEVWNLDANQQVNLAFWDRSGNPTVTGGAVWNTANRVYTWIVNTPYSPTVIDIASQSVADNATWNLVVYLSTFTTGDIVRINYDNPIQIGVDNYRFTPGAGAYSQDRAVSEVEKINVFPNPYYGVNSEELNKYNRFVTFTHLPAKATIRIFNLAGVLVQTIQKDDPGQFQRWNLANESGLPVASGLYIAYIELPELGETKILKVAIIQEQQILDRF